MSKEKAAPEKPAFKPLGHRILVRRLGSKDKTEGGIIVPDSAKVEEQYTGIVVVGGYENIGPEGDPVDPHENLKNLEGKKVFFVRGIDIKVEGKSFLIVESEDIIGVSTEES